MKFAISLAFALAITAPFAARAEQSINDSAGTFAVDCATDPEVSINGGSNTVTVTGACDRVSINGATNTVTIETSTKVAVSGATNTVMIDGVDKLAVTGVSNTVTYKHPIKAKKTKVSKPGLHNTVKRIK